MKTFLIRVYFYLLGILNLVCEIIRRKCLTNYSTKLKRKRTEVNCNIVITGGSKGIGLAAVHEFLQLGCTVIVGCRSVQQAKDEFANYDKNQVQILHLDISNLKSVRRFADDIKSMNSSLHVLVNNAGILEKGGRRETIDGYEAHFGTNYLGHVLLTYLLLNLVKGKEGGLQTRVINVSSCQHGVGSWLDFEDLNMTKSYSMEQAYGNSKAAMVMFSQILETEFNVSSVSLHPGVVYTDMATSEFSWVSLISRYLMKSSEEGGSSLVYAALDPILYKVSRAGKYLENNQLVNISSFTASRSNQIKLWDKTCCMLKLHF